jgi:hypothetical protein
MLQPTVTREAGAGGSSWPYVLLENREKRVLCYSNHYSALADESEHFFYWVQLGCTQRTHFTLTPHACASEQTQIKKLGGSLASRAQETCSTTERAHVRVRAKQPLS